jgi:serine acetyltransferase
MSGKANLKLALAANSCARHGKPGRALASFLKQLNRVLFACDIGIGAQIDPSCTFYHLGLGCVIHEKAIVGRDCRFFQHATIGSAWLGGFSRRGRAQDRQRRLPGVRVRASG